MIEKSELAVALAEARSLGKADPSIIDQFNRLAPGCDRLDAALDDATLDALKTGRWHDR